MANYSEFAWLVSIHNAGCYPNYCKGTQRPRTIKISRILKHPRLGLGRKSDRQQLRVSCIDPVTSWHTRERDSKKKVFW